MDPKKRLIRSKFVTAINILENSTLPLDENTSENKTPDVHDSENSSTITVGSDEARIDICETTVNNYHDKGISQVVSEIKNKLTLTSYNDDDIKSEIIDDCTKREDSVIKSISDFNKDKDLKHDEANDVSTKCKQSFEQNTLENDNLEVESLDNCQSAELTTHNESDLNETVDDFQSKINSVNKPNNLNTVAENSPLTNSVDNLTIDEDCEMVSTSTTVPDATTNTFKICNVRVADDVTIRDIRSVKSPLTKVNGNRDSTNVNKSDIENDSSICNDFMEYEDDTENTTESTNVSNTQSAQQKTSAASMKNQNDSFKDKTEETNEVLDIDECIISQIPGKSVSKKNTLLLSTNVEDIEENNSKTNTIVKNRKSRKRSDIIQDCVVEENEQGRIYFISKTKYGVPIRFLQ